MEALALTPECHVVAIASGGCNVLSYLIADPGRITAVDLARAHVALNRLKLAAARHLPSWQSFYRFFGEADEADNIAAYWRFLGAASRRRDARLLGRRARRRLRPPPHLDVLAQRLPPRPARPLHRARPSGRARLWRRPEQYAARALARGAAGVLRDVARAVVRQAAGALGNGAATLALRPRHSAGAIRRARRRRPRTWRRCCASGSSGSPADFRIDENYFAWQAFGRAYAERGAGPLPPYLERAHFDAIRDRADRVEVLNRSFTEYLTSRPDRSLDRYVLLDAQDWMSDVQLNDLWREITRTARPGARVIFRTAAAPSLLPGRVDDAMLRQWHYEAEQSQRPHAPRPLRDLRRVPPLRPAGVT